MACVHHGAMRLERQDCRHELVSSGCFVSVEASLPRKLAPASSSVTRRMIAGRLSLRRDSIICRASKQYVVQSGS